ncbi:MAG: CAP domain-containing protein, partial [Armatimonadetes bacterium]|nr:CAP domain-containing protein [Armatimonadota bacterium]
VAADDEVALKPWWSAEDSIGNAAVEERICELVNAERKQKDLGELVMDPALRTAARQHSREMVEEGYFSHTSPHAAWAHPSDRAYRAGYWEAYVAENIIYLAGGPPLSDDEVAEEFVNGAHGWMLSSGHRHNILDGQYVETGVGVFVKNGKYYATQLFGKRFYDLSELTLEDAGDGYVLSGRAKLLGETSQVRVARDGDLLDRVDVHRGRSFTFKVTLPKDGRHRVGLHPARDERSYWLKFVLYLDTKQPLESALIMPYED